MVRGRAFLGYAAILAVGLGLAAFVRWQAIHDNERALAHYTEDSQAELTNVTRRVQDAMTSIYENLRTLTLLPSVRKIDRYGTQIGNDGRETIQQIYNNLANTVSVSEVYIVPVDLDPDAIDAATGNPEEPILMFDQLIVHGGMYADAANPFEATRAAGVSGAAPDEIEIYEYRLLRDQQAWLQQHFPDASYVRGLNAPMISGPEVITCDNTEFAKTHADPDRSGVLFSVPFFGPDDKLKGTVTAIILSNALRRLLPEQDFALINVGYDYTSRPSAAGQERASANWVGKGVPDPNLIFSAVAPLKVYDADSPWAVWVGFPDSKFFNGQEARSVRTFEYSGYGVVAMLVLAGLALAEPHPAKRQAGACRECRPRTAGRGTHRRDTPSRLPRRADRLAEQDTSLRQDRRGAEAHWPWTDARRPLHRSRSLQGRQRYARPSGRRLAASRRYRAAAEMRARGRRGGAARRR